MSLTIEIASPSGFPANVAAQIEALLRAIDVAIEVYPSFEPSKWEGGFLPIKVQSMPVKLSGVAIPSPILSGVEIDFVGAVASVRSPASRSVVDYALFYLTALAMARVTGGSLSMDGIECRVSTEHPFSDAFAAVQSFIAEASEADLRLTPFEGWEKIQ